MARMSVLPVRTATRIAVLEHGDLQLLVTAADVDPRLAADGAWRPLIAMVLPVRTWLR